VQKRIEQLKNDENMYVPSSVLIRGGYGLFGENLEEDLYFKIEAGETGDIEFRISKLN